MFPTSLEESIAGQISWLSFFLMVIFVAFEETSQQIHTLARTSFTFSDTTNSFLYKNFHTPSSLPPLLATTRPPPTDFSKLQQETT